MTNLTTQRKVTRKTKHASTANCIDMLVSNPTGARLSELIKINRNSAHIFLKRKKYEPKGLFDEVSKEIKDSVIISVVDDTVLGIPDNKYI